MTRARAVTLTPAVLAVVAALTLSACSMSLGPFRSESPSQLATTAAANWSRAAAHRVEGGFDVGGLQVTADEVIGTRHANGAGSGAGDGKPYQLLEMNGRAYLKGQSFWQAYFAGNPDDQMQARGYQENWTMAGGTQVAAALTGLSDLDHLVPLLRSESPHLRKVTQGNVDGQAATELGDGKGHFWWITTGDGEVVKATAAAAGSLKLVALDAGAAPAPAGLPRKLGKTVVNPSDPTTMPARYVPVAQHEVGSCGQTGCAINVTVENQGGTPTGQGTVMVKAYRDQADTKLITTCTADIPPSIPSGQSGTATCTLSGAAWSTFVDGAPGGGTFYVMNQVTADPPYV